MGDIVVLSSDDGMETMKNRGKSSEVVQWEKYLPKTVLRVLLVESDDSTRQIITAILRKCSYKVVAVSDGLAAWETLKDKSHNVDLILTELDLPSISGFALLALVMEHEACKNIPVIMMSSEDSITMVLKCMLRGAADYLIKPMRKNELKNLWQHVWRRLTLRDDPNAHAQSLPASQQNLEDTDEASADSRYHSKFCFYCLVCSELGSMGDIVVLSSDDGMETMKNRGKSSEVVQWEKYLPKTVLRVLLVESDDSTRQIITAILRKCSYKVVAVSDGLAAWETLKDKSHNVDLILTELDLPSISGFALLALVMEHEACKNIPVIMMSSEDSITMVLKCMLRGAADYLIKPMRKNELKNLWQHVWRRLTLRDDPNAHAQSLPASQQNLEDTDEASADSRYHSDQGSGAQAFSYHCQNKLMEDAKPLVERDGFKDSGRVDQKFESFDVTMDLIGGIDKRPECVYGNNTRDEYAGPELGLSLKRSCSGSFENQDESKHQKLSLSDASAFSRFENSKPAEKAVVALEASSSADPKTPTESHEKLRKVRSEQGSATTSSNQDNIGSSSISGQCGQNELSFGNQVLQSAATNQKQHPQDSPFPVESNRVEAASKEGEVGSQSTCNTNEGIAGQSGSIEKPKEEESVSLQQRWSQREAALMKFRLKRKDRCFDKKVRYQSRKKLAEQRPRVKGQFVRAANSDASTKA